ELFFLAHHASGLEWHPEPPRAKRAKLFAMSSHTCSRCPRSKQRGEGKVGAVLPASQSFDASISQVMAVQQRRLTLAFAGLGGGSDFMLFILDIFLQPSLAHHHG
ncbi:hypothetical protein, partial [Mesorhizobium captivum]|uniref:hypothetical protein n=1 Tax=Mesorhizobium captivum TaxID=3072319 RepID=UPI002A24D0AC